MFDWTIHNRIAWVVWLMAAFALSNWFYGRAKDATHTLEADPKPSPEEAATIRGRMIGLASWCAGSCWDSS